MAVVLIALLLSAAVVAFLAWYMTEGALHVRAERRFAPDVASAAAIAPSQEVEIAADDGARLRAWYFPGDPSRTVYILHGFTDSRSGMLDHIRLFVKLGYSVLAPDSRAHGINEPAPGEPDIVSFGIREAADARRWLNWLFANTKTEDVFAFGQSMGAAVALLTLASEKRWRAIIAEAPFTDFARISTEKLAARFPLPEPLATWLAKPVARLGALYALLRYAVDLPASAPARTLPLASMPVLLIHGEADDSISAQHSRDLHALAPAQTSLWIVPKAGHTDAILVAGSAYENRVAGFLATHVSAAVRADNLT